MAAQRCHNCWNLRALCTCRTVRPAIEAIRATFLAAAYLAGMAAADRPHPLEDCEESGMWPDDPIHDDWVEMWTQVFELLYPVES